MTDQPPPAPTTIVGAIAQLGGSLVKTLPTSFLVLVLLNLAFLGLVMWFLNNVSAQRLALVGKLLDACLKH